MTTESVEYILSAKDSASSVIRQSSAELELLNDQIQQTAKGSQEGAEAVEKLARSFGGGWAADAATQMKDIAETTKKAAAAMQAGGAASVALKAGLAGLAVFAGYKIYETTKRWTDGIKDFTAGLHEANIEAERLSSVFLAGNDRRLAQQVADIKEFGGTFEQQAKAAEEVVSSLNREIGKRESLIAKKEELLITQKIDYWLNRKTAKELENYQASIERDKREKESLLERRNDLLAMYSDAERERVKRREDEAAQKERTRKAVADLREMYEQMKEAAAKSEKEIEDRQRARQKQAVQNLKEMHQEMINRYKEEERLKEKALQKDIKASADSVKAIEKEIADLDKMKTETSRPVLNSQDERMTSLARGSGDIQQQIAESSKRQVRLMELNQKLQQENAKYLKLIAEKEEKVIEFAGAG